MNVRRRGGEILESIGEIEFLERRLLVVLGLEDAEESIDREELEFKGETELGRNRSLG